MGSRVISPSICFSSVCVDEMKLNVTSICLCSTFCTGKRSNSAMEWATAGLMDSRNMRRAMYKSILFLFSIPSCSNYHCACAEPRIADPLSYAWTPLEKRRANLLLRRLWYSRWRIRWWSTRSMCTPSTRPTPKKDITTEWSSRSISPK